MADTHHDAANIPTSNDGLQPGHDIFFTPNNDSFYANYTYPTLDTSEQTIRLVRILPGTKFDPIECTLLEAKPLSVVKSRYTALSYCAGDARRTKTISLNGYTFRVFANLAHALGEIRDFWKRTFDHEDCIVWIDQICIDQHNIRERSHQVRFMRRIYESAERVLVCLSTRKTDPRGFRWILRLDDMIRAQYNGYYWRQDDIADKPQFYENSLMISLCNELSDEGFVRSWLAFYDVAEAQWWSRSWVFQEFIVASQVQFLYSGEAASPEHLSTALQSLSYIHRDELVAREHFQSIRRDFPDKPIKASEYRNLDRIIDRIDCDGTRAAIVTVANVMNSRDQWSGVFDLKDLLTHSRYCKTTDLRDKIFAFIGLTDPEYGLLADYSQSLAQVLTDTTIKIIEMENSLDVLCFAVASQQQERRDTPSWVADWTAEEHLEQGRGCHYSKGPFGDDTEFPRKGASASFHKSVQTSAFADILRVTGAYIDKLAQRSAKRWLGAVDQDHHHTFRTSQGILIGCSNSFAELNDEVWIIKGSGVPLVLRLHGDRQYKLICTAYINEHSSPEMFCGILLPVLRLCQEEYEDWQTIDLV